MPVCDLHRADSRTDIASLGTACRGFAGVFRLGAPDTLRGLATETSGDAFAHSRPTLSLGTGPSSRRIRSADARRQLVVTGGLRHGAALRKATALVESRLDPAALLELPGGLGCAFALHDSTQGTLILGRDGIGVMPFYVSYHADRIAFATEMGAFASLPGEAPGLDAGVLATYLDFGFNGGHHTALRGIERVMPGELIHIGRGLQVKRQRRPSVIGVERANGIGFDKARQVFDTLFEPTVASLVDAQQPSGLLLSGGLDSAVICNALRKASKGPVNTLAVGYDFSQTRDELTDARRIAELCDTRHTEIRLSREALWRHIPWTIWRTDELMDDPASLPTSLVSGQFGRGSAIFTGEGADDVFAGDGRYRRKAFQRYLADVVSPGSGGWRTRGLWGARQSAAAFGRQLVEARAANREDFIAAWAALPDTLSWLQRAQWMELSTVFPNTQALKIGRNLDDATDSVRMPFLDPAIVRFGLALDDRLKVRGRVGKVFLREWACSALPRDHVMKRKRGFHVPVGSLLRGENLDRLEPVLLASTLVSAWFKRAGVVQLFAAQRATGKCTDALWRLLYLAIWHTLFVLRPDSRPTPSEDPLAWII